MNGRSAEVLVVGGGPAGLAAAWLHARAGRSVALLEAGPGLGGMAASTTVAGQRVDLGSHRLHPAASGGARGMLDELLGDDLQTRVRHGRLHLRDRWVPFPFGMRDLATTLPRRFAARSAVDQLTGPLRREQADTFADVVRAGLGPAVLADFYGPYARKLWGVPPEALAGELARRRISVRSAPDLLRQLRRPGERTFLYPRLGYGQIVDRLAEAATAAGAEIVTGAAPGTVLVAGDEVHVTAADTEWTVPRVLWTAPLDPLARAVPGGPAERTTHRALVLAYLVVETDRWTEWDAHYVPDPDVAFVRLSEPKNYRDGPDPAGQTVLCAELACSVGDATWTADEASIGAMVADGIARLGLPVPAIAAVELRRLPHVYPVITPGTVAGLTRLRHWADGLDRHGITVLGRQGLFVADNLHHVLDMALATNACLSSQGWDARAWSLARARFDAHVVED